MHKARDETAARLAAIVESSDDAIVSKDLNGYVTSWNAAAERMFGYPAAEMIGRHITTIIPADRRDEEDHVITRSARGGASAFRDRPLPQGRHAVRRVAQRVAHSRERRRRHRRVEDRPRHHRAEAPATGRRRGEPRQGRIPGDALARAPDPAQHRPRLHATCCRTARCGAGPDKAWTRSCATAMR